MHIHAFSESSYIPSCMMKTLTNIKKICLYSKLDDAPWYFAKTMFHSSGFIDLNLVFYLFLLYISTAYKKAKADRR